MQQMQYTTNGESANDAPHPDTDLAATHAPTAEVSAAVMLETVPLVMRAIRAYMRNARAADLSVPQFRALAFLKRHPGTTLADVAEYVGLTPPATSRMIDGLVAREYALRQLSTTNRRCIELRLSEKGAEMLEMTLQYTQDALARLLAPLSTQQRATIIEALEMLAPLFSNLPESRSVPTQGGEESEDGELAALAIGAIASQSTQNNSPKID